MATKKKPARSSQAKSTSNKGGKAAKGAASVLQTNDNVAEKAGAIDDFVAAMPCNTICHATPTRT